MNTLAADKKLAILRALAEGCSLRSVSRMTGTHRTTIMRLLTDVGEKCSEILDVTLRDIPCQAIECDEVWTLVRKKEKRLTKEERLRGDSGDFYIFVGLDPNSKLVASHAIGKRDSMTTDAFVIYLRQRVTGRPQLTTDGFRPYLDAIEQAFGSEVDYATLVKDYEAENPGPGRYAPPKVTGVEITWVWGNPDRDRICTSYVERNNLTVRLFLKGLNRLTLAFSKKLENLRAAVAFWFWYYNFCWIHRSLRVTPAMAAGITDHVWELTSLNLVA